MTPCCANSHMSVPLRVLTVRTSLHTYICHKYTYIFHHRYVCISTRAVQSHTCTCHCGCSHLEPLGIHILTSISIHVYEPLLCEHTYMFVPLRVLTVRTSLYTCKYSDVYIHHITNTCICEPMLCELTYVCAPASART